MPSQDRLKQGFDVVKRILADFNAKMQQLRRKHREEMATLNKELTSKKLEDLRGKIKSEQK